jgi:hypothetical protein
MQLGHDIDFEEALADELVMRVGDKQIGIREEQVSDLEDLEDELGAPVSALRPDLLRKYKARKRKLRRVRQAVGKLRKKGRPTFASTVRKAALRAMRKPKRSRGATWGPVTGPAIRAAKAQVTTGSEVEKLLREILAAVKVQRAQKKVKTPSTLEPHLDKLARQIERNLDPRLKKINKRLRTAGTQRTATSEHNAITRRAAYRRKVLKNLATILKQKDHPLRRESVRVLGNVLGPAGVVIARPRE